MTKATDKELRINGVRFSSDKKDDRRNKTYERTLTVATSVHLSNNTAEAAEWRARPRSGAYDGESIMWHVHQALTNKLDTLRNELRASGVKGFAIAPRPGLNRTWDTDEMLSFECIFKADKPSAILDEDECIRELGGQRKLEQLFAESLSEGLRVGRRQHEAVDRAAIANHLLRVFAQEIDQQACKVARLNQRMAALRAELQAEREEQTKEFLAKLEKDNDEVTFSDGITAHVASVQAAKAKLAEYVAGLGMFYAGDRPLPAAFSNKPADITLEDMLSFESQQEGDKDE